VSRYKLGRSQKTVMVQDFNCVQMSVSGCRFWQGLSWEQGAAKTMTNNLPILSVLAFRANFETVMMKRIFRMTEICYLFKSRLKSIMMKV
jgi:hypothetical protein